MNGDIFFLISFDWNPHPFFWKLIIFINKKIMKHLLNDLSGEERNRILEQYNNSLIVETSKFNKLLKSKLGDVKPLLNEQVDPSKIDLSKIEGNMTDVTDDNPKIRITKYDAEVERVDMDKNSPMYKKIVDFFKNNYGVSVINVMESKNKSETPSVYEAFFPKSPTFPLPTDISFEIDMDKINDQEYRKLFDMVFKTKLRDIDKTK